MDKKELLERLDELADGDDDKAVLEIRSLIESSGKRTVSKELVNTWAQKILLCLPGEYLMPYQVEVVEKKLCQYLSELGVEVKE